MITHGTSMMCKPTLVIMQGAAGSGKSTIANKYVKQGYQVVCADNYRYTLGIKHNGAGWTRKKEDIVHDSCVRNMQALMLRQLDIVSDGTHTTPRSVRELVALARAYGYDVVLHAVHTTADVCKARRAADDFPTDVIDRHHENMADFDYSAFPNIKVKHD